MSCHVRTLAASGLQLNMTSAPKTVYTVVKCAASRSIPPGTLLIVLSGQRGYVSVCWQVHDLFSVCAGTHAQNTRDFLIEQMLKREGMSGPLRQAAGQTKIERQTDRMGQDRIGQDRIGQHAQTDSRYLNALSYKLITLNSCTFNSAHSIRNIYMHRLCHVTLSTPRNSILSSSRVQQERFHLQVFLSKAKLIADAALVSAITRQRMFVVRVAKENTRPC